MGLPRARLTRRSVVVSVSRRWSWADLDELGSMLRPSSVDRRFGAIEGYVRSGGKGIGGIVVSARDRRCATSPTGWYRLGRVSPGTTSVALDLRHLSARLSVLTGATADVELRAGETVQLDFELEERSYLQGALLQCGVEGKVPVAGADLTLVGDSESYQLRTSSVGGFLVGDVVPGRYQLVWREVGTDEERSHSWPVDLTGDRAGMVLTVDCPLAGSTAVATDTSSEAPASSAF